MRNPSPSVVRSAAKQPWTRRAALLGIAAVTAGSLAACGPGASTSTADTKPTAVSTDVGSTKANLTLFAGAGTKDYQQALVTAFEKKYPAISIKLQVEADNNYNTVLPRLLASNDPPDLAAPADLIGGVKDGLLTDLSAYEKAYGWDSKIPKSVLDSGKVSNGKIGSGPLYVAGGAAGPIVGVYYNRALAQKVGVTSVPATIDDLQADLAKAKAAGVTPIMASNADGLVGHLYNLLLGSYMGPQKVLDVVYHANGASLQTSASLAATTRLAKWAKAGYFNSDVNAINQDSSYGQFAAGKGLFMFQGTWMTQALPASFNGKYGIFPMPPLKSGGQTISMTGNTLGYAIAAKSKEKDAAALFLNFLTTAAAGKVAVANGYPSATTATSASAVNFGTNVQTEISTGYKNIAADNGFYSWIQNSVPEVNTALTTELQSLVAGKASPADVTKSLQSAYKSGL